MPTAGTTSSKASVMRLAEPLDRVEDPTEYVTDKHRLPSLAGAGHRAEVLAVVRLLPLRRTVRVADRIGVHLVHRLVLPVLAFRAAELFADLLLQLVEPAFLLGALLSALLLDPF